MAQRKSDNRRERDEADLGERMMIGAGPQTTIGDDLQAARLARGEDLQDIAAQLRIRHAYLDAIERGDFEALPGPTYAIGFVRAYARYLSLDANDMIARFKIEAAGLDAPAELTFPEPVSESRVPRGGLVVIALLLAVAAYGGWYYLSTRDMTIADIVPAVPGDLASAPEGETANLPPEMADLAPPPPETMQPPASATESAPSDAPSPSVTPPAPVPQSAAPSVAPAPPSAAQTAPASSAPAQTAPAQPAPSQSAVIPAVPNLGGNSAATSGEAADAGPRVYGEGNADARIVLRARGDSWVQIRASDDSLVMTRTLRSGDSYRVPNQRGLKLMTGNAGALDIVVDGEVTPSLGPFGAVRRNVALDVERLKAGTAAPQ